MAALSRRDWAFLTTGFVVGLAIAAFALSVGWCHGRAAGIREAQKLDQDWWEYTAKTDVITRWEESHLPPKQQ
jgi:hypothetical protein